MNPLAIPGLAQLVAERRAQADQLLQGMTQEQQAPQFSADGYDQRYRQVQDAYRQMLESQLTQPQFQMPQAQPNKGLAIGGGILALLGALTGDRSAVPAFGQFAGGISQDQQARQQRLLQEQQIKMQNADREARARRDLLGFDLEMAGQEYQNAAQKETLAAKRAQDAADAEADRAFKLKLAEITAGSRLDVARTNAEASLQRAKIAATPKSESLYKSMVANGVPEAEALNVAYQMSLYEAKVEKMKSGAAKDKAWAPMQEKILAQRKQLFKEGEAGKDRRASALLPFKSRALDIQEYKAVTSASGTSDRAIDQKVAASDPEYGPLADRYKSLKKEIDALPAKIEAARKAHDDWNDQEAINRANDPEWKPEASWILKRTQLSRDVELLKAQLSRKQAERKAIEAKLNAKKNAYRRTMPVLGDIMAGSKVGEMPPSLSGNLKLKGR